MSLVMANPQQSGLFESCMAINCLEWMVWRDNVSSASCACSCSIHDHESPVTVKTYYCRAASVSEQSEANDRVPFEILLGL